MHGIYLLAGSAWLDMHVLMYENIFQNVYEYVIRSVIFIFGQNFTCRIINVKFCVNAKNGKVKRYALINLRACVNVEECVSSAFRCVLDEDSISCIHYVTSYVYFDVTYYVMSHT